MNPVTALSVPVLTGVTPSSAATGSPFLEVLNSSIKAADAPATPAAASIDIPVFSADTTGKSTGATSVPIQADAANWPRPLAASRQLDVDVQSDLQTQDAPDQVNVPAAGPMAEAPMWPTSLRLSQQKPDAGNTASEEPASTDDEKIAAVSVAPAPVALPVVQMQPQVIVAAALSSAVATPSSSKETSATRPAGHEIDTLLAQPKERAVAKTLASAQQASEAEKPEPLLPIDSGLPDGKPDSFQSRFGISLTPASATMPTQPASAPVSELRQLALGQDSEWIAALSRDIVSNATHNNQLKFTLMPETLGQLDVALNTDKGQVDIRLETSTAAAAQIISADQTRLIEDLRQAGLKLGQFEMSNRQNGNGQHKAPTPERQNAELVSTPTQPAVSSRAQGRFA